jgi:hypothetical protein
MIVGYTMLGEKVAINNGEGWDGEYYYDIATNFFNRVQHESYNKYRIQRVFPFAIINAVTEVCHIEKTHENMLPMMQMLNAIALMACVMFFYLTSNRLRLALVWESIWFASLFYCFPILKAIGYYPYSTDLFGYLCGFAIYYFFLKKNSIGLFITAFCGAYTWPVVSISALALAFLRTEPVKIYNQELGRTNKIINKWIKIAFVALPLIYIFLEYSVHSKFSYEFLMDRLYCISRPVNAYIFVLSVLCVGLYLFCIVKPITINVTGVISDLFTKHKKNLLLFLVCYILIHISTMLISNDEIVDLDMYGLVRLNVLWATSNPFVFLVNHFLFYGFSIVLIIMFWKKLAQAICDEGIGFVGILTLIIFFLIAYRESSVNNVLSIINIPISDDIE